MSLNRMKQVGNRLELLSEIDLVIIDRDQFAELDRVKRILFQQETVTFDQRYECAKTIHEILIRSVKCNLDEVEFVSPASKKE